MTNDLSAFLPFFWTSKLRNAPVLGHKYDIIDLSSDFIDFIESDSLILDEESSFVSGFSSSEEYLSDNESNEIVQSLIPSKRFPELHNRIKSSILDLGGIVIPKLNWTVPKVQLFYN